MILLPAIDLYGGHVVRLRKGTFSDSTTFPDTPEETALRFRDAGATDLHVIDLEGAECGAPVHLAILARLKDLGFGIRFGGGLRTAEAISRALGAGADFVYAGSALSHNETASPLRERFSDRIVPAVDVRAGRTAVDGWKTTTRESPEESLERLRDLGWNAFLVTSVERDGCGLGPDLPLYSRILSRFPGNSVMAAGGVATIGDIRLLKEAGLSGAILGRALYDGALDLSRAFAEVREC